MIICPHCDKQIEINEDRCCPHCKRYYDLCDVCKTNLPDIDDFGICICNKCLTTRPDIQKALENAAEKEKILFGYED